MLITPVCRLLEIEYPIIQAGMGGFTSAKLVAGVSNAGGLGSIGAGTISTGALEQLIHETHELTNRPFAINHTLANGDLDPVAFSATLGANPKIISFSLGDPQKYIKQIHDAGILVMQTVSSVRQAEAAGKNGIDIPIAQGSEAGGFAGSVSTMTLVLQIVDAVNPLPVVAAGGIADGRGLAAALVFGAQGVNVGTRFLASIEAPISDNWKQAILEAESTDTVKLEIWTDIIPSLNPEFAATPRSLHSQFIDDLPKKEKLTASESESLRNHILIEISKGNSGDLFPFAGQSVGLIKKNLPAAEIVHSMVKEAEEALKNSKSLLKA